MTDQRADAQIDAALEALARPQPAVDHVARVLARTGAEHDDGRRAAGYRRLRWALPVAASLLVAASVTWGRRDVPLPEIATDFAGTAAERADRAGRAADGSESRPYHPWGAPREIDRPVLPPQAYWGMDAFEEWRRLGRTFADGSAHRRPAVGDRSPAVPRTGATAAAARLAWAPVPSGLPPIELESIEAPPLTIVPLAAPTPIDMAAITLEPIVTAPLEQEERP